MGPLIYSSEVNLTISRLWRTVAVMAERLFVILRYVHKTPILASCEFCHIKFFTPLELTGKPREAEEHLRDKFASHTCKPSLVELKH